MVTTCCLGFGSSWVRLLATPKLSGSNLDMSTISLASILKGNEGSPVPMVADVSVMVGKELGTILSPSCLICCSEPAGLQRENN